MVEKLGEVWYKRNMDKTFFFYDLETSGLKAREDRIMQFAGQRTSMDLGPIGEPVNILVKMTDDALPSPKAIMVTKITPQKTLEGGINEAEFCRLVTDEIFTPGTCAVGYNTVRFDDEFMRATFWRNFYEPYEFEWKDERSRWDMLDVVRLVRALRPEGITWPFREDGKPTNRLELLTKENGLSHEHAHDALSDVYATIAVAKLIREKQPKMFEYLFKMRGKRDVAKLVSLTDPKPFVYASGRYSNEFNKTTVVFPLTAGRNGNVMVFDLRFDPEEVFADGADSEATVNLVGDLNDEAGGSDEAVANSDSVKVNERKKNSLFPIVKELCLNKCPAVAPVSVLEAKGEDGISGWERIGLTREKVEENLRKLVAHPEFAERVRSELENRPEFAPAEEPEGALYDGFLNDADRVKVSAVRAASATTDAGGAKVDAAAKLADFHPEFADPRLPELLLHYKGRNFPKSLSETEMEKWESYRRARLERQAPKFLEELAEIEDDFIKEELMLYFQSLGETEY